MIIEKCAVQMIGEDNGNFLMKSTNGIIDDVRIYNRVLTASEVATIYACRGSDSIYYGCLDRWLLNEGSKRTIISGSNIIKDMVGAQHGSPIGSPAPTWDETFLKKRYLYNN